MLGSSAVAQATPRSGHATPRPRSTAAGSWQQVGSGPTGGDLTGATVFGDTPAGTREQVSIVLNARNRAELERTVGSGSKHFVTVAQFAQRYGQSPSAVAALTGYLARFGIRSTVLPNRLSVTTTGTAGAYDAAFNVTQHQYRVPARRAQKGFRGLPAQTVHAPAHGPQLPRRLARDVTAIFGLSNYSAFRSDLAEPAVGTVKKATPSTVSAMVKNGAISSEECLETYALPRACNLPQDFVAQYGLGAVAASHDGGGRTIGIVSFATGHDDGAQPFWDDIAQIPETGRTVTFTNIDGGAGAPNDDSDETDTDVQQAGGVAPGADIVVYQAPNTDAGAIDAFFRAAADNAADSVSLSWSESETYVQYGQATGAASAGWRSAFDLAFLELAAQGQSTFVASGDWGAYGAFAEDPYYSTNLAVSSFAASPWVTATGGTTLPFDGTLGGACGNVDVAVPAERAWGWDYVWGLGAQVNCLSYDEQAIETVGGSGGGFSTVEPQPVYQRGVPGTSRYTAVSNLTPTGFTTFAGHVTLPTAWTVDDTPTLVSGDARGRAVPDVSADADPYTGYLAYYPAYGFAWYVGGTSLVAPQFNGAAAIIDQAGHTRSGLWNPAMYAAATSRHSPFTPLNLSGAGNDNLFYTGTPGTVYNPAAGLGTADLGKLAAVLTRR